MDKYVNLVTNTFLLVSKNRIVKFPTKNKYGEEFDVDLDNDCGDELECDKHTFNFQDRYDYDRLHAIFSTFTLLEMKDALYQLVPFATNWVFTGSQTDMAAYVNTLPHVKMAIKYVESAID